VLVDAGGAHLGILFAAHHPERTSALILFNATAQWRESEGYPGLSAEADEEIVRLIEEKWGTEEFAALMNPSKAGDRAFQRWMARSNRASNTPRVAAIQARLMWEFDIRSVLPTLRIPALVIHRKNHVLPPIEHGRFLAEHIPGAVFVEVSGSDGTFTTEASDEILIAIEEFLTGARRAPEPDRVLASVLFTDIVGSTERAASLGDRRWKELLEHHDVITRRVVEQHRGRLVKTTGDGVLATFDGPGRAIRCARELRETLRSHDIEIRAGLHTGEIELRGEDVGGIAVHIGARVAAMADTGELLVSGAVPPLMAGSGIEFDDRGAHTLKGVPGEWRLYSVKG